MLFLLPIRLHRVPLLTSQKVEPSDTSDCYTVTILDIGHASAGNLAGRRRLIRQFNISILTGEESTIIQGPQHPLLVVENPDGWKTGRIHTPIRESSRQIHDRSTVLEGLASAVLSESN